MAVREIEIEILPDGTVKGDIKGFKGAACREVAKKIAEIVGEEFSFDPSSEYYEASVEEDVDIRNKY